MMWKYWLLLAVESLGDLIVFIQGIPAYRRLLEGRVYESGPPLSMLLWVCVGIGLIQGGYWVNRHSAPKPIVGRNVVADHIVHFLGRLNFIFVSGVFAAMVFKGYEGVIYSVTNMSLIFVVLFSVYCYTLELERLGASFGARR